VEVEMLPQELRGLVRHMEWADALVWRSVLAVPQAHTDTRMRESLYHLHVVQWAYLHIWRGEPLDAPELESFKDLTAVHAWGHDYYRQALPYLDTLELEELQRQVQFPWAEQLAERFGSARPATLAETILQITSHTMYHRGQVNTRVRELGGEPRLADFIAWIWMGRPDAEWEGQPED
jgi:uncharacterized damage-inducible protein DinB